MRVRELQIAYRRRPDLPPVDGRKSLTCPTAVVDLLRAILEYQKRDRRFGGLTSAPDEEPVTQAVSISAR